MRTKISVVSGDIAAVSSDALITPINSGGVWFGALDSVIQRAAGGQFHLQARQSMPLQDGQAVIARKQSTHRGAFGDVIFVIDDLQKPLREVILAGLKAADTSGYKQVTLPTMRMGVMLGVVEKSIQETIQEMSLGVQAFLQLPPAGVESITFVVYSDPATVSMLTEALHL